MLLPPPAEIHGLEALPPEKRTQALGEIITSRRRRGIKEGHQEPSLRTATVVLPIDQAVNFPASCVGREGPPPHPGMTDPGEMAERAARAARRKQNQALHPILPPTTAYAHEGEDDLLHMFHWPKEDDPRRMLLRNMSFWDNITCEMIKTHTAVTSRIIPDKLQASMAHLRSTLALHIESLDGEDPSTGQRDWSKGSRLEQVRAWKLWSAFDLLLFGSLKEGENKDKPLKEEISERLTNMREGDWHLIWPFVQQRRRRAMGRRTLPRRPREWLP